MLKHIADRTAFASTYSMSPIAWYFSWANTTQGYDYWCKLSNKFELLYF